MKISEVSKDLIGKRCNCISTGAMVTGTIESIEEDKNTVCMVVRLDTPQVWGDQTLRTTDAWARKFDEFGTLHHLTLL